jgi:hypothetical protein
MTYHEQGPIFVGDLTLTDRRSVVIDYPSETADFRSGAQIAANVNVSFAECRSSVEALGNQKVCTLNTRLIALKVVIGLHSVSDDVVS